MSKKVLYSLWFDCKCEMQQQFNVPKGVLGKRK